MNSKTIFLAILTVIVSVSSTSAFADHSEVTIETANNDLAAPGCLETEIGCYTPNTAVVDVGGVVTMTNTDEFGMHTFTAGTVDGVTATPSDVFDSGILNVGNSFEYTPDTVGEIPYYCMLHTWMQGLIIVQEVEAEEHDAEAEEHDAEAEEHDAEAEEHDAEAEEHDAEAEEHDEGLMVTITDSVVNGGTQVDLEFSELHVNYEITATQNGETILQETSHAMDHKTSHMVDAVGSDDNPIDIKIVSLPGEGDDWNGPTGTVATTQVVPEFGTIAMMILAVAIISIVAVTAKSRVIPRF